MGRPKVAFVHDYLLNYGGAEKCLEALTELYPEAPIFTSIYDPERMPDEIKKKKVICPKTPLLKKFPKYLSFLMPLVFEHFDLRKYDIIISDSSAWSKGVLTTPDQLHIGYIHTPPRFLYKYSVESSKRNAWYFKPFISILDSFLRVWDFGAAQRPDYLIANSKEVQARIKKFYSRNSTVISPPVETCTELPDLPEQLKGKKYFLVVGRLVSYKNFDLVIKAFQDIPETLVIIGTGSEEERLKEMSGNNVIFLGRVDDKTKGVVIENCLGVINPVKDEDFGIVPVESMLYGKPVLAHRSGGHLETIEEGVSGMFFDTDNSADLAIKIREFSQNISSGYYSSEKIKTTVQKFSKQKFQEEMKKFVEEKWNSLQKGDA